MLVLIGCFARNSARPSSVVTTQPKSLAAKAVLTAVTALQPVNNTSITIDRIFIQAKLTKVLLALFTSSRLALVLFLL